MRRALRLAAGLSLGLALAACGSTVPLAQRGANGGDGAGLGDSLSSPAPGSATTGAALPSASGGSDLGTLPQSAGTTGGSSSTGTTGSTGQLPDLTAAPGALTPIHLGIAYVKDAAAGFQAIGIQGSTLGDMKRYAQVLVDDANRHGGLGGRKIIPVYFAYDVNPGTPSLEQQDATACATFTQDNHVDVAIVTWSGNGLWECMKEHHIPSLSAGPTGGIGAADLKQFPTMIPVDGFNLDRRATEEVHALVRDSYFTKWDTTNGAPGNVAPVKIGIITYDFGQFKESVEGPMVKALEAAGYPKPQVIAVAAHDSYDDLAKMQTQLSSAELSFRANGVTHVIIWDDNGVSTLFFMQNAEKQSYRPRYGISSGNNMQLLSKGLVSAKQLTGAVGMGWVPAMDIADAASYTSSWSNPARRACYKLMNDAQATGGQGFNENSADMYCAPMFALEQAWAGARLSSPAGLVAALEGLGSRFVDPSVPAEWLSPGQHDGTGGVYEYLYDGTCSCMKYKGAVQLLTRN